MEELSEREAIIKEWLENTIQSVTPYDFPITITDISRYEWAKVLRSLANEIEDYI